MPIEIPLLKNFVISDEVLLLKERVCDVHVDKNKLTCEVKVETDTDMSLMHSTLSWFISNSLHKTEYYSDIEITIQENKLILEFSGDYPENNSVAPEINHIVDLLLKNKVLRKDVRKPFVGYPLLGNAFYSGKFYEDEAGSYYQITMEQPVKEALLEFINSLLEKYAVTCSISGPRNNWLQCRKKDSTSVISAAERTSILHECMELGARFPSDALSGELTYAKYIGYFIKRNMRNKSSEENSNGCYEIYIDVDGANIALLQTLIYKSLRNNNGQPIPELNFVRNRQSNNYPLILQIGPVDGPVDDVFKSVKETLEPYFGLHTFYFPEATFA